MLLARTQPLVASEIAALNRNLSGLVQHGTTVVSDAVKDLKSFLVAAINTLTQQIAQNQAPQKLLLVPPEVVKDNNESFGDILSTTTLTSRSPPARRPALDVPPATVAPGPSLESNTQARPVAEGWPHILLFDNSKCRALDICKNIYSKFYENYQ